MPEGILHSLRHDHEEILNLIDEIDRSDDHNDREILFKRMMAKLLAHSHAEHKVLYEMLKKSNIDRARDFVYKSENEHQLAEHQLQWMLRAQNKASEQWSAQLEVLRDLVAHHVHEEERFGFDNARREFDGQMLDELGQKFLKEKEKQLSASPV